MLALSFSDDVVMGQSCDITGCDGFSDVADRVFYLDPMVGTTGFAGDPLMALDSSGVSITQLANEAPGASLYDLLGRALQVYQLDRQQKAFLETNRELLLQGKAPIAWDQFQPTASVGVQLDSNTRMLLWGVGGVAALALLATMLRKR